MTSELVLAIDLGSSWCKAAYVDWHGSIVAEGRVFSRTITDEGEHRLDRFWQVVAEAVRLAGGGLASMPQPAAIGLSCRGLFGICLDRAGEAFIPSYNILSIKTAPEVAAAFRSEVWGEPGPYGYGYAVRLAGLIAGLRMTAPDEWRQIHRVGALHNYIVHRLCGRWVTDPTTGPSALEWPAGLMELSGLPVAAFPDILSPWTIAGGLTPEAANALALPSGIPVVTGLHDGAAANVGTGAVHRGDACLTLGTNFAVRVVTGDRPRTDCFGYVVAPGQWAWVSSVPRVATQLDLVATTLLASPDDLAAKHRCLGELAATVAAGARLPSLPLGDDTVLLGAVRDASRSGFSDGEIYLAMLRAAAAGSHRLVEKAKRDGAPATRFVATGGGSRNRHLLRVLESTLGHTVDVGHPEAGLLGAGMVAAIGAGWHATLADAQRAMAAAPSVVHYKPDVAASMRREVQV
jgi:xylulokinase